MKRKRHTPEEIIKKLREAEGQMAAGKSVDEAARAIEVSLAPIIAGKAVMGA